MDYKAKAVGVPTQMMVQQGQYELFKVEKVTDVDAVTGESIEYNKNVSIGIFNVVQLEQELKQLAERKLDLQEKLDAIKSIINNQ